MIGVLCRKLTAWAAVISAGIASGIDLARAADCGSAAPFADHDVVCFVGDSITHLGEYPEFVELFYATRFPLRSIEFYDCGISGDRASTMTAPQRVAFRVDADILGHHPTVATILLGANDVERSNYGLAQPDTAVEMRRQQAGARYRTALNALISRLQQAGVRVILLTPSIYDDTVRHPQIAAAFMGGGRGNAVGTNTALGQFAQWEREQAAEKKLGLADFYAVMNEINRREQRRDPDFTLTSQDRLHPAELGHFVMAYTLLKAQRLEGVVAEISVDAMRAKARAKNGVVSGLRVSSSGAEFDCLEQSLPFVPPGASPPVATSLVPFSPEFNRELLIVDGLAPGLYRLTIDGVAVAEISSVQLAVGIDLADNPTTPQRQQAEAAAAIAKRRMAVRLDLRAVAQNEYAAAGTGLDVSSLAALRAYASQREAAMAGSHTAPDARFAVFAASLENPGGLEQTYAELGAELHRECQPHSHHFAVTRMR